MIPLALFALVYWLEDRRRVTEVGSMLEFTKFYDAYVTILAEKRI
ncbi:hypothetical protein [Algoriphagus aquimarinus]